MKNLVEFQLLKSSILRKINQKGLTPELEKELRICQMSINWL